MDDEWDFLLFKFRSLGGIAENICQKEGKLGRGIFSIDQHFKSRIWTPSKLMINKDDIYLEDNKIRIKKEKQYSYEIRDFFNYYQDKFSWGEGGNKIVRSFEKGLKLMTKYKEFDKNLEDIFDLNYTAKLYALYDIGKIRHSYHWHNQRFYYNPKAHKLEHIAFDCYFRPCH